MATLVDEEGSVVDKRRLLNRRDSFAEFLESYSDVSAVVEACWNWSVAVELLDGLVDEITLAHPYKLRAVAEAKIKTDSIDSEVMAQLLRADLIPRAYLRDKKNLMAQRVLRARSFCVRLRTQVKNRIHYIVDSQEEEIRELAKAYSDLFGKKGLKWLKSLELPDPDGGLLADLLAVYEVLSEKIKATDRLVKNLSAQDEDCKLLKTIPGLGDFLALLVKIEIGDIGRFRSSSHLCSYAGLVPSTYSSGGKCRHGRITKQGNKWLRWAMVEAVVPAMRSHAGLRAHYNRIKYRRGSKVAKVATARRLLCIVHRVLREKDSFRVDNRRYERRLRKLSGVALEISC